MSNSTSIFLKYLIVFNFSFFSFSISYAEADGPDYWKISYKGSNAVYLGDRILPKEIGTLDGKIFVDYLNREDTEPMSGEPSIETRKWFKIQENILIEIKK